jgi:putative phage-type endonuclease
MEFLDMEQGSDIWIQTRKRYITSTDVANIMGIGFKTPYQLYLEKMDLVPPQEVNEKMKEGTRLEPIARDWINNNGYYKFEPKVAIKDIFMASLDGINDKFVLEIKCGAKSYTQAQNQEVPPYYYSQIQQQLYVSGFETCAYLAFNGETGLIIPVQRDQEFIDRMIPACEAFYKCLMTYTPPPMTEKDYVQNDDPEVILSMDRCIEYQKQIKFLEGLLQAEKSFLIQHAGQSSMKSGSGKITRIMRRGAIDYGQVEQLKGIDLELYRKPVIESWRISSGE